MTPTTALVVLLTLSLAFAFLNGFHDSANVVATIISSRAMSPRAALWIAAAGNFAGPFLFGYAVARTIGTEVALPEAVTIEVIFAALVGASLWNLVTWFFGIPTSSSHALIGGIVGPVLLAAGPAAVKAGGLVWIGAAMLLSPLIGFLAGVLLLRITFFALRSATPRIDQFFKAAQIPTALAMALSHGTNDGQKTIGIITLGLVVLGYQENFAVPVWVTLANAAAIGLGTAAGGWRIIHTLGGRFYRIRPVHSFVSQLAAAAVILTASLLGGPVSTTQVVSSSILGAGAAHRKSQVRWSVLGEIFIAWLLTVPASALMGGAAYLVIVRI